jgi:hypothetical protein
MRQSFALRPVHSLIKLNTTLGSLAPSLEVHLPHKVLIMTLLNQLIAITYASAGRNGMGDVYLDLWHHVPPNIASDAEVNRTNNEQFHDRKHHQ